MTREDELVHDITLYLKENEMDELYITRPDRGDDTNIRLSNLYNITTELSDICIEPVETYDDIYAQVTYYIKIEGSTQGYNLILSSQAERMDIQNIEDLAKAIDSYEREAKSLLLTIK